MIWLLYLRFVVPVLGAFYGTSLISDEVEDRTITYLFTRPVPRGAIIIGKYLAYLVCTALVVLPSVTAVYLLITPVSGGSIGGDLSAVADRSRACWRWGSPSTARSSRSSARWCRGRSWPGSS